MIPKPLRKAGLARASAAAATRSASPQAGASRPRTSSTALVLQHILHPVHKEKRRVSGEKHPEIIVIDDEDETMTSPTPQTPQAEPSTPTRALKKPRPEDAFDALEIVNLFKIDPKTLGYFTILLPTLFLVLMGLSGRRTSIRFCTSRWTHHSASTNGSRVRRCLARRLCERSWF